MKKQQISDQELIVHYLQGNEACLEMLVKRHKSKIYTSIYLVVQNRYLAEDLFQETFIKIIHTLRTDKYNDEGKFLPWAIRIARNLAIDHFRKMKKLPTIVSPDGEDIFRSMNILEENREDQMMRKQTEKHVRDMIKKLPEEQREVIILRHYADLSFKEIADITGVSINTALGRMRYALNNLRKLLVEKEISLQ
jgi:RNA polymerase sigma factor (sigma-70 family)